MFRSKSIFNHLGQALAGAFLLAMIVAGVLGITNIQAARSTPTDAKTVSLSSSNLCAAEVQSSDYYLRQEEAVLNTVSQGNWTAAEMAPFGKSPLTAQACY